MSINLKYGVSVLALAAGIGIAGSAVKAVAAPLPQEHEQVSSKAGEPDYSKNKTYQQGMREGQSDHAHNLDHSKKRHFAKDEDQKAYEAGYQKGHGN
jgi:hypothetical protein